MKKVKVSKHKRIGKNKVSVVKNHARSKKKGRGKTLPKVKPRPVAPKPPLPKTPGKKPVPKKKPIGISKHPDALKSFKAGIEHLKTHAQKVQTAVQGAKVKAGF